MVLIDAQIPLVRSRELTFPAAAPTAHLGAWTLLEQDRVLASPTKTSLCPNGICCFTEDRAGAAEPCLLEALA